LRNICPACPSIYHMHGVSEWWEPRGVVVNHGIFTVFKAGGLSPVASSLSAAEASILSNFMLNDAWAFKGLGRGSRLRGMCLFHLSRGRELA